MKHERTPLLYAMVMLIAIAGVLGSPNLLLAQGKQGAKKAAKFSKAGKATKIETLSAAEGDTLTWSDSTSDLYFHFMDASLLGVETEFLKKGDTLSLVVQAAAKKGTYSYAIFRLADLTFVTGNSPPTIIIP